MSKKAEVGNKVTVNYKGKFEDGTVFYDSSKSGKPFEVTIGAGQVFPKLDDGFVGMEEGQSKQITLLPDDAYGKYNPELRKDINRSQFPPSVEPKVGMSVQVGLSEDKTATAIITSVNESSITLDLNHPLAGKTVIFDIQMEKIQ